LITEHHIPVTKSARYFVLKPETKPVALVYALHGYKQLGPYFIKQFQALANQGAVVVAPEGLHRFYINGYSGRVGASWMTKENRETDIKDYLNYLNAFHQEIQKEYRDFPLHLLGFSQGGATACYWIGASDIDFKSLILYASVFPDDFDFEVNGERLTKMKRIIAFGDKDQFAPEETIEEKLNWLKQKKVEPELLRFAGGHEIIDAVLLDIWAKANN